MDPREKKVHEAFPRLIWVVIEQPPGEKDRFVYDPEKDRFQRTTKPSLFFTRGWPGAYGWVAAVGRPPGPHINVCLITQRNLDCGNLVLAHPCGLFRRADGNHKLVALDDGLRSTVLEPDLPHFDESTLAALEQLYPTAGEEERWYGAQEAREYLQERQEQMK